MKVGTKDGSPPTSATPALKQKRAPRVAKNTPGRSLAPPSGRVPALRGAGTAGIWGGPGKLDPASPAKNRKVLIRDLHRARRHPRPRACHRGKGSPLHLHYALPPQPTRSRKTPRASMKMERGWDRQRSVSVEGGGPLQKPAREQPPPSAWLAIQHRFSHYSHA